MLVSNWFMSTFEIYSLCQNHKVFFIEIIAYFTFLTILKVVPKKNQIANYSTDLQVQGVPFTIYPKEMAVALKRCIFDPMLVKPKSV